MQGILLTIFLGFLVISILKTYSTYTKLVEKGASLDNTVLHFFSLMVCANTWFSLGMVDPYGVNGLLPPTLYKFCDQFGAFFLMCMVVSLVDFYIRTASNSRFRYNQRNLFWALFFLIMPIGIAFCAWLGYFFFVLVHGLPEAYS